MKLPHLSKFMQKVECLHSSCWDWAGYIKPNGYGTFMIHRKVWYAHRLAYTMFYGAIPSGLWIDHLCRNRKCVNPMHLEAVSPRENTLRGFSHRPKITHCLQGHEFSPENTGVSTAGSRWCKTCTRIRDSKRTWRRNK